MTIELLLRGRYRPLPGATARPIGGNAWEVRLPRSPEIGRLLKSWEVETLDSLVISIDGRDSAQVIGSGGNSEELVATVLLP